VPRHGSSAPNWQCPAAKPLARLKRGVRAEPLLPWAQAWAPLVQRKRLSGRLEAV
jgi:hypothetical protein